MWATLVVGFTYPFCFGASHEMTSCPVLGFFYLVCPLTIWLSGEQCCGPVWTENSSSVNSVLYCLPAPGSSAPRAPLCLNSVFSLSPSYSVNVPTYSLFPRAFSFSFCPYWNNSFYNAPISTHLNLGCKWKLWSHLLISPWLPLSKWILQTFQLQQDTGHSLLLRLLSRTAS